MTVVVSLFLVSVEFVKSWDVTRARLVLSRSESVRLMCVIRPCVGLVLIRNVLRCVRSIRLVVGLPLIRLIQFTCFAVETEWMRSDRISSGVLVS